MKTDKGVEIPGDMADVLAADADALHIFQRMRPSCQREYVQWVTEAKREETRARRLAGLVARIRDYGARHGMPGAARESA